MLRTAKLLQPLWKPVVASIRHHPYPKNFVYHLRNMPDTQCTQLANGLIVATESRDSCLACVGLYINAGSRHESQFENGIAHFFEHMVYKGTCTRSKEALTNQMSRTGAKFNNFTTREMCAFWAECMCQDVQLIVDILADCIFNNCLAPSEIEYQKSVVFQEMLAHDQDVNTLLFDYLHATAFQDSPLAQTVMGPSGNLYNFCDRTIANYTENFFNPARTVLAAVGGITHEQMLELADLYLLKYEPMKCVDSDVYRYSGSEVRYRNDSLPMANVAIAFEGPCFCDPDSATMDVATAMIGGWDRSQPGGDGHDHRIARAASLNDFCDAYKGFNIKYKDTGLWGVQFISSPLNIEDMLYNIQDELMYLCNMTTDSDVERARREVKTKLLTRTESVAGTCHEIGRWMLCNSYRPPLHERVCAIDNVNALDVKTLCDQYIYDRCPAVAAVGPTEALPEYSRIRASNYWLRT